MAKHPKPKLEKLENSYLLEDKFMMPGICIAEPYGEWAAVPIMGKHNRYMVIHNGEMIKACTYDVAHNLIMKQY